MPSLTNISARNFQNGSDYYGSDAWHASDANITMTAGYRWNNNNWVICMRFTLPTAARSISLNFTNDQQSPYGAAIRYKFADSFTWSLANADSTVAGDGQFSMSGGAYTKNSITITKSLPAGTHFLYLWTANTSTSNVMRIRWYANSDGNGFSANYTELPIYTINYNKGAYGSGTNTSSTKTHDVPLTLAGAIFTRTGYSQTGWSTTDGGPKVYELLASYTANAGVSLYPYWTANSYNLTLDPNGGKFAGGSRDSITVGGLGYDGSGLSSISIYGARRNGYGFMGWFTSPVGGTMVYDANNVSVKGTEYWDAEGRYIYLSDVKVYAQWNMGLVLWALFYLATRGRIMGDLWVIRKGKSLAIYRAFSASYNDTTLEVK